jgi:hypothetical protein
MGFFGGGSSNGPASPSGYSAHLLFLVYLAPIEAGTR